MSKGENEKAELMCQFLEQNCLQKRREQDKCKQMGERMDFNFKIVVLYIFVPSLAQSFCLGEERVDLEIIG